MRGVSGEGEEAAEAEEAVGVRRVSGEGEVEAIGVRWVSGVEAIGVRRVSGEGEVVEEIFEASL